MGIIIGLFSNILALYLANMWVPGFVVNNGWKGFVIGGLVIGILNLIVRPLLKLIAFPVIVVSLGLFLIVINAVVLWLAGQLTGYIVIESYAALLWATLMMAVLNFIAHRIK